MPPVDEPVDWPLWKVMEGLLVVVAVFLAIAKLDITSSLEQESLHALTKRPLTL